MGLGFDGDSAMARKHDAKGRSKGSLGSFVALQHYLLDSPAYRSLTPPVRCAYLEVAYLFNGSNNGRLAISSRRLAERLGVHKSTAGRALNVLTERGFIEVVVPSSFGCKLNRAAIYRLTAFRCDVTGKLPSKAFMKFPARESRTRSQQKPSTVASEARKPH